MFLTNYISPENAEGTVAELYGIFPEQIGIPAPLQAYSTSPELMLKQGEILKYFGGHDELEFPVLAAIRFIAASHFNYDYCMGFNRNILRKTGLDDTEIDGLTVDPSTVFEEKESVLLSFVAKAIKTPSDIDQEDVDGVRQMGWTDKAIFDAVAHGGIMASTGIIYNTFKK